MGTGTAPRTRARARRIGHLALAITAVAVASSSAVLAAETSVGLTAGARASRAHAVFGAHLDTPCLPLRVGLDWVFR